MAPPVTLARVLSGREDAGSGAGGSADEGSVAEEFMGSDYTVAAMIVP